jgi:hypothetical protein
VANADNPDAEGVRPESDTPSIDDAEGVSLEGDLDVDERIRDIERRFVDFASSTDYPSRVSEAFAIYASAEDLSPGDLVQWKTGMRGAVIPTYGYPAVIVERLDEATRGLDRRAGWSEISDVVIGVVDHQGDFVQIAVNSRRLTRY